jgi:hypothetical protein
MNDKIIIIIRLAEFQIVELATIADSQALEKRARPSGEIGSDEPWHVGTLPALNAS